MDLLVHEKSPEPPLSSFCIVSLVAWHYVELCNLANAASLPRVNSSFFWGTVTALKASRNEREFIPDLTARVRVVIYRELLEGDLPRPELVSSYDSTLNTKTVLLLQKN